MLACSIKRHTELIQLAASYSGSYSDILRFNFKGERPQNYKEPAWAVGRQDRSDLHIMTFTPPTMKSKSIPKIVS